MLPGRMATPQKSVIITGASRGIGRAIALRFARDGYRVYALARTQEALQALKSDAGPDADVRPLEFDASAADAVARVIPTVLADGVPTVLVNNAGIALSAPISKTSFEDYERTMAINLRTPFLLCKELMPLMAKAGGGRVINIASTAAMKGFKYTSAYCASKHALLGLTRALAVEYAAKNVTVNAVCPGWTDTDMLAKSAESISKATGRSHEDARQTLADMNPMGKLIRPEDVAELCAFLAGDAASTVTGAAYLMDAGESA